MKETKVLITGITGQTGSYMADYLLKNTNFTIYGMVRRVSTPNQQNIKHLLNNPRVKFVEGDLSDGHSILNLVKEIEPNYFINLAAQSFVGVSWKIPEQTFDIDTIGVIRCLEAIRQFAPYCRFYNAGSSEEFGDVKYSPQDEKHPLSPRSPYGAAKSASRHIVKVYRESYGLYAVQGLLFNHESERRGGEFVTRKITKGVARIKKAIQEETEFEPIELGNLDSKRDWSHAEDFVDGIWRMLNQELYREDLIKLSSGTWDNNTKLIAPHVREYVLSSNETHSIREFVQLAFKEVGLIGEWHLNTDKNPESELFVLFRDGFETPLKLVKINKEFYRPAEVDLLLGDSTLARKELGWSPQYNFKDLVSKMVSSDLQNE